MLSASINLRQRFLSSLINVLGQPKYPIALHEPKFAGNEISYLMDCIGTGWVSSVGRYVDQFEHRLAEYTVAKYAVAVVNGTAALQVALQLVGVSTSDEVIIPTLSFVATANAVMHCGAVPHFVDCDEKTLGLDSDKLGCYLRKIAKPSSSGLINRKTGKRIAAIVPMHTFGHPIEMNSLLSLAAYYQLPVVEDAAESLGSFYHSQHTGTLGDIGILSFNGNKIITTGGGGAILTNNKELAIKAKHLTTTAKLPHRWEYSHDMVAFNYRMPNINAALGCAQLEMLSDFLLCKKRLAKRYQDEFRSLAGITFFKEPAGCCSNYWLNTVLLDSADKALRDDLLNTVYQSGFYCRPAWQLLHTLPMFKSCPSSDLSAAVALEARIINLPSGVRLVEGL